MNTKKNIGYIGILVCLLCVCLLLGACGLRRSSETTITQPPVPTVTVITPAPDAANVTVTEATPAPEATPEPTVLPVITPAPTPVPAETPVPTPVVTEAPAPVVTQAPASTPAPANVPVVTKNPTDESLLEGGDAWFVARYQNAKWAVWHFVSPDGTRDLTYDEMSRLVPTMSVENGMYSDMTLRNVTLGLNGWKVYCRYSNNDGYTNTAMAYVTVYQDPTPRRTGVSAFAFYEDGTVTYIYQLSDGTWELDSGIVYYLGTDGVYRSRGHADLYTQQPHPTPYRTGVTMTAYYYNGNATTLYEMSDASWMTDEGGIYYEGMNGVLHCTNGYADLYANAPEVGPYRTGVTMEVFYMNGNATTLYAMSDASWMTDEGAVYYEGMNGVFHSTGNYGDLYVTAPELG